MVFSKGALCASPALLTNMADGTEFRPRLGKAAPDCIRVGNVKIRDRKAASTAQFISQCFQRRAAAARQRDLGAAGP